MLQVFLESPTVKKIGEVTELDVFFHIESKQHSRCSEHVSCFTTNWVDGLHTLYSDFLRAGNCSLD